MAIGVSSDGYCKIIGTAEGLKQIENKYLLMKKVFP